MDSYAGKNILCASGLRKPRSLSMFQFLHVYSGDNFYLIVFQGHCPTQLVNAYCVALKVKYSIERVVTIVFLFSLVLKNLIHLQILDLNLFITGGQHRSQKMCVQFPHCHANKHTGKHIL